MEPGRQLQRDLLLRAHVPLQRVLRPRGHTYDFCRVTLAFNVQEGSVEGTDIAKLVQVFGGQLGGPMAGLAPLIGEMLGVQRAAIDIEDDGLLHSVRVGDVIDFQIQDIVPFGVETGEPVRFAGMFHPVGSDLVMAEAKRTRIDAFGITYEGKTGLSKSSFSWAA